MTDNSSAAALAWQSLVDSLGEAGRRMDEATRKLSAEERTDGFRALARALSNQLGRLEVDDASPELAPFNLWRQKFYMDNPDCLYWVAEIARGGCYRTDGVARSAVFTSVNVYAGSSLEAQTVARITTDELACDAEGRFTLTLGGDPGAAAGQWVEIPEGANLVWVRQFYDQPEKMDGSCTITRLDEVPAPPIVEVERFTNGSASRRRRSGNPRRSWPVARKAKRSCPTRSASGRRCRAAPSTPSPAFTTSAAPGSSSRDRRW